MNGLDKLVARISGESDAQIKAIIDAANAKAAEIKADSDKKMKAECERIEKKAQTEVETIEMRSKASAELKTKQILLTGKQELLNDTIGMAKEKLSSLSDQEYVDFIKKLFSKHVPSEDAVLKLNAADLKRIPQDVIDGFVKSAEDKGAKLTVSSEAAEIKNGFVLDFGGIEENCTFDALIDQNIEELQDKVKSLLFA
ncbi:MAG: V-type ATP synthase subunit E family protein [Lachnospiraceae bacterium]|nr:V-type ATP synthase subunit E family protein [Lachnospiraceae bacterium]